LTYPGATSAIPERLLRKTKYPFAPEAQRWKGLAAKLDTEAIKPGEPLPPSKVYVQPRAKKTARMRGTAKQAHWKCPAYRIGEHEMEDPNLGWEDPMAQASSLRSARFESNAGLTRWTWTKRAWRCARTKP
jgi:hypothetical protein